MITGGSMEFNIYDKNGTPIALTKFAESGKVIYDYAIEKYKKGNYFPIWGTCMGF